MKLLTMEELGGIDSTSKTIEKWDEFLKKAVWNLGFRQSLIDGMYPYDAGIPMLDGTTMPVSEKTGRVFYKMSWAEKLCGVLSCYKLGNTSILSGHIQPYAYIMLSLWVYDFETFHAFFPERSIEDYSTLIDSPYVGEMDGKKYVTTSFELVSWQDAHELWKEFIDNCDIYSSNLLAGSSEYNANYIGNLTDTMKRELKNIRRPSDPWTGDWLPGILYFYCKTIKDNYTAFPKNAVHAAISRIFSGYDTSTKWLNFNEVYLQDYLVISLNPIDKLMCSTKQAFSSCMSIAKQDDTRGTCSAPALGLPSIFATDAIYMVYMTPGKHKNMYWEEEQWAAAPDNRDKEKAYKYLKMTCRALTYKCTMQSACKTTLNRIKIGNPDCSEALEAIEELNPDRPRLMVGRQYSTKGEDYSWEVMVELFLAREGIATSLGFTDAFRKLKECQIQRRISATGVDATWTFNNSIWLRKGNLTDHKFVTTDRYGYRRGIYYDNLSINWLSGRHASPTETEWLATPVEDGGVHLVTVGTARVGSHGVMDWTMSSNTDMFKVMTGKMSYASMNSSVKICSHCGEILTGEEASITTSAGDRLCRKCAKELDYKYCDCCKAWYSPSEAPDHEVINLRKFLNPSNWQEFPEMNKCKRYLKQTAPGSSTYLCAHCGEVISRYYGSYSSACLRATIEGVDVQLILCDQCMSKAVMCDKCRRVLFLDSIADACLLLPKRRVICPDCIDSIRLKQDAREKLKAVLQRKEVSDFDVDTSAHDFTYRDLVGQHVESGGRRVGRVNTLIKDAHKQITSFLKSHPEETFPVLKSSNPPLPDENTEVEDTEIVVPF